MSTKQELAEAWQSMEHERFTRNSAQQAREEERAAIITWLRKQGGPICELLAFDIEAGEHLK